MMALVGPPQGGPGRLTVHPTSQMGFCHLLAREFFLEAPPLVQADATDLSHLPEGGQGGSGPCSSTAQGSWFYSRASFLFSKQIPLAAAGKGSMNTKMIVLPVGGPLLWCGTEEGILY